MIDQTEFVRFTVDDGTDNLIVDLGRDSPPEQTPRNTDLGPTLGERDLAARKTLALFGRAEGRDFADVYVLADRFGRGKLLKWAQTQDAGFDKHVFADMIGSVDRLSDQDIPVPAEQVESLRQFFSDWVADLRR